MRPINFFLLISFLVFAIQNNPSQQKATLLNQKSLAKHNNPGQEEDLSFWSCCIDAHQAAIIKNRSMIIKGRAEDVNKKGRIAIWIMACDKINHESPIEPSILDAWLEELDTSSTLSEVIPMQSTEELSQCSYPASFSDKSISLTSSMSYPSTPNSGLAYRNPLTMSSNLNPEPQPQVEQKSNFLASLLACLCPDNLD